MKRPETMSHEDFKQFRKEENKATKEKLKGTLVYTSSEIHYDKTGKRIKKVFGPARRIKKPAK